jgi:DNA-directed RNA polymerase specialized sigma subunit
MQRKDRNDLRNEAIARRYFQTDETSKSIAKDYGITKQRAFQIAQDYVKKYGQFEVTK